MIQKSGKFFQKDDLVNFHTVSRVGCCCPVGMKTYVIGKFLQPAYIRSLNFGLSYRNYLPMKTLLTWKKVTLSSTYEIFEGEDLIGKLKNSTFSQTAEGMIHQKGYQFKTKGFFKQETQIIDAEKNQVLGTITYNSWKSRATIQLRDQVIQWKYNNTWQTRWSLYNEDGVQVKFAGGMSKGIIECEIPDDLLILTGLYVTNYYRQIGITVMVAVFLPIWLSAIN